MSPICRLVLYPTFSSIYFTFRRTLFSFLALVAISVQKIALSVSSTNKRVDNESGRSLLHYIYFSGVASADPGASWFERG